MAFGDLSNQGEPQADAALCAGLADGSVEGLEDSLALRLGNTRSAVCDDEADTVRFLASLDLDLHWNFAVPQRVLEQIPNEPSKQSRIAIDHTLESSCFFGSEREQIDAFSFVVLFWSLEPTRDQQFSDQFVQLLDIAVDASEKIRSGGVVERSRLVCRKRRRWTRGRA